MKITKKVIAVLSSFGMILTLNSVKSYAQGDDLTTYTTGDAIWQPVEDTDIPCLDDSNQYETFSVQSTLPSSIDNSTSEYFPPIGNQGEMGSCAGWATTYYQYTYEVNKLRNVTTDSSNIYSPAWTYNYINGGSNCATYLSDAYDILKNQGAMKLADFPHPTTESAYSFNWSTDVQKMTTALHYRVSPYYVSCYTSSNISNIKQQLANGKVGVVWTNSSGWTKKKTTNNEYIIVRGSSSGNGGHFMTVVGYDDNITVNINGETMKGAFKLANSWGTDRDNNGFVWVAYDALNSSTGLKNNWDSNLSNRTPVFGSGNNCYFVNANFYRVYFTGKVTYISNDPWHNNIYGNVGTSATTSKFIPTHSYNSDVAKLPNPAYRVIVFDYFNTPNPDISNYLSSQFTTKCTNNNDNTTYRMYLSLIDNSCKLIRPYDDVCGSLSSGSYSRTFDVKLKKGRISSYDDEDINASDVSMLSSYLSGKTSLSSLQFYLADMNDDDIVNVFDLVLLRRAVLENNNETMSLSEYVPELECSMQEFIENELGEDIMEYAEELELAGINY